MRFIRYFLIFVIVVFALPAGASLLHWQFSERPLSWRQADWGSSGLLPSASDDENAAIYILAARTGGLKGALAVHSWLVVKAAEGTRYDRYDKVGWGQPVRRNSYPADGRWYSNDPFVVTAIHGEAATRLLPEIDAAISSYPFRNSGDYRIWPGPNSNSFIAHILDEVPELQTALPPTAVGRDFRPGIIAFDMASDHRDIHITLGGLIGFAAGARYGLEIQFLGLVAGFDFARPAIKVPGWGRFALPGVG
ncbi:DUF3750 domain-containing protein [Notoacmeibacter sp. MSK16QG-6]|uniref:DUF3750 domain-containing protein n=1 Tax=Notoacmeibacter sp. MSK16QG-6 TaxID=2957982 RepID=UPI0020A0E114|nr:DUF3750 domain-containing protein [Notoacmeibacter sp. MSK16QG-6]MCP1198177.1 DUF3750 domain-containing protein [Notoacmeibacter sp. MSK16QG-6]